MLRIAFVAVDRTHEACSVTHLRHCRHGSDMHHSIKVLRKNEQVKKIFWALFIAMAGLVLARVLDSAAVQQIVGIITSAVP